MRLLVDSHVLIWLLNDPQLLGPNTRDLLESGAPVFVSVASLWELGLKHKKGKLPYSVSDLLSGIQQLGAELMDVRPEHIAKFESIELAHKDPFDTLLIAQAENEGCLFLTEDADILKSAYQVQNSAA